jgi:GUN4-like
MGITHQLVSEVGVDYNNLAKLLVAKMWRQADEETRSVMLKISRRVSAGWLREEDFANFPCSDLETIDYLWSHYSFGRFGFTAQSRIWDNTQQDYIKFSNAVEWCHSGNWQQYTQLQFHLEAPTGHLPAAPFYKAGDNIAIGWAATLAPKLVQCLEEVF